MDNLVEMSKRDENYVFERIYRNLYNEEFFLEAYAKLAKKEGNMTEGTDGKPLMV